MNLDHVAINVGNLEESIEWYVKNLKATIHYQDETWALLNVGNMRLALTISSQHPPHIAYELESLSQFPHGEIKFHRDGSAYLYVQDPSGNVLEYIYWPKESTNNV